MSLVSLNVSKRALLFSHFFREIFSVISCVRTFRKQLDLDLRFTQVPQLVHDDIERLRYFYFEYFFSVYNERSYRLRLIWTHFKWQTFHVWWSTKIIMIEYLWCVNLLTVSWRCYRVFVWFDNIEQNIGGGGRLEWLAEHILTQSEFMAIAVWHARNNV